MFLKIGTTYIALSPTEYFHIAIGEPPPTTSDVTPVLTVSYLDGSSNRQTVTVVDGVTTITGVAPFAVEFDGSGSFSVATDSDTAMKGFNTLGSLFVFGENKGTTWSTTGRSVDTERGGPIAGYVFTDVGTKPMEYWIRNSAGQQNRVRLSVVVNAPASGVDMTSGVIPDFANDTVYNAPAGGTWGNITSQLTGKRNIIIRKSGAGADPVFGTVTLDNRNEPNNSITRTKGIRFLNCDVARIEYGNVGFDDCSFVNGRVRVLQLQNMYYAADQVINQSMTTLQASNVRMARGLFLQNTGQMEDSGGGYVLIGEIRGLHCRGVTFVKTSTGQHNVRGVFKNSSFRNCVFNNIVTGSVSYLKLQGWECTQGVSLPTLKGTPDEWPETDMVVQESPRRRLGLPLSKVCVVDCIMGLAGSDTPDANLGFGPENNIAGEAAQGVELTSLDFCITPWTTQWYTADATGRYIGIREYRLNNGAGALVDVAAGTNHPNRTPDGWAGPYYTTGARPEVVLP